MDRPGFLWASGTAAVFAALPIVSEHSALAVIDPVKCGTLPPTPDLMPFRAADADFPGTLKGRFGPSLLHFCLFWILGSLLEGILFGEVLFFPQNLHAATPTEIQTNARQMQPADVSEPVWFEEEAPPIVWFVHGMLFMRDDFERELAVLRRIFPNADAVTLKAWDAPHGPGRTLEAHWDRSVGRGERFARELAEEIAEMPAADRKRLVLVGHSLGGRIAVRALARNFRREKLTIRQLILAGAAIHFDDSDIREAVAASELTAYSLVNPADVMLRAYLVAEGQSALGTGCLYPMPPTEFYEISLFHSVDHFAHVYFERLHECILKDDFSNREILVPHVLAVGHPHPMTGHWTTLDELLGWKFQKHSSGMCRILNEENERKAFGFQDQTHFAFLRVRQQLVDRAMMPEPVREILPADLPPILNFQSLGSDGWWLTVGNFQDWRLQKNRSTFQYRILDPHACRRAAGNGPEMKRTFEELIHTLRQKELE